MRLAAALVFALSLLSAASAAPVTAQRAADFQHIWGTAGHGSGTQGTGSLAADIAYTGIKQWRDGTAACNTSPKNIINGAVDGIIGLPWFTSGSTADIPTIIGQLKAMVSSGCKMVAFEGFNEPIFNPITYQGQTSSNSGCGGGCIFDPVAAWMRDYYAAIKADPALRSFPVYQCTLCGAEWNNVGLQFLTIPNGAGTIFPAGTIFADVENEHVYPIFDGSAQTIQNGTDYINYHLGIDYVSTWHGFTGYSSQQANANPKVITEFGFQVCAPAPNGNCVDAATSGKNVVTGLLNAFAEGYQLAAVYTFYPWSGDTGWNIFSSAGNPMPAATYMHNLSGPIADVASNARSFTPGNLDYTISGLPAGGTSLLLQKSNGQFELVIWNNVQNWNKVSGAPITVAASNVTVTFAAPQQKISVYDTTNSGTSPISTSSAATSMTVNLTDHAMVVEVSPYLGRIPYPAPYVCNRNFYVATTGSDVGGCGTSQANACASIQGANNNIALQAGDCVNVAPGVYNTLNSIVLTKFGSSNQASGYVVYKGAPNNTSKILFQAGGSLFRGVDLTGNKYVILDGFEWDGNNGTVPGEMLADNDLTATQHHIWIMNNVIHDSRAGGVILTHGDYFYVMGNVIHDTMWGTTYGKSGIHLFEGRQIPGFTPTLPWDTQYYHTQVVGNVTYANGCLRETQAQNCGGGGPGSLPDTPYHTDGNGIDFDDYQNRYTLTPPATPFPPYPYHALVAGNVSYGNGGRGISVDPSSNNIEVYNNTTYGNGLDTQNGAECEATLSGSGNVYANNILMGTSANEHGCALRWNSAYGMSETGNSVVNNLTWNGTAGSQGLVVTGTTNDAANLAYIQAAAQKNKLGADPLLSSVATQDFHPLAGSPVIGAGTALPVGVLPGPVPTNDGLAWTSPQNIGALNATGSGSTASTVPGPVSIVTGGPAAAPFVADAGFNGGTAYGPCACGTIDTSLLINIPPQGALNYQRYGQPQFHYIVSSLAVGKTYMLRLYFTEDYDASAGQRKEDILINGNTVLANLDIYAEAGAQHKAIQKTFFAPPDGSGNMTIQFNAHTQYFDQNAKVDAIQVLNAVPGPVSIVAGGPAVAPFAADDGYNGGTVYGPGGWTTDMTGLTSPPPAAIFQYQRYGTYFAYVAYNLTPGKVYTVNLYFSEDNAPDGVIGARKENVTINGTAALAGFDIYAAAGALNKAVLRTFQVAADAYGAIMIEFAGAGGTNDTNAKVDAIQVLDTGGSPPVAQDQAVSTAFQTAVQINLANGATNTPTSAALVGSPSGGTVSLSGMTATFTPNTGFSGNGSFKFTLSNSNGVSNQATATIAVGTLPPAAQNQSAGTLCNQPVNIDLAAGSTGGPTSAAVVGGVVNGSVTISGMTATYTPTSGFSGIGSFNFTLTGSSGTSNQATASIAVGVCPQPPAAANQNAVTQFQTPVNIALNNFATNVPTTAAIASGPSHGTVTLSAFTATYTPATGFVGSDSFQFTLSNATGVSNTATAAIVVNPNPSATCP